MMRALHVIPAVAQRYGGPSEAIVGMGRALPRVGVYVLVAATDADGDGRLPVPLGVQVTWQGVQSIFFPRQWSESFKYSAPLATWLGEHVTDFDVVHIHAVFSHACLAAAAACQRRSVPYIVRPLGTLDPWSLQQKSMRKQLLLRFGARRMLASAAAVHYTTMSEQRLAESTLGLRHGVVIPLGVGQELFDSSSTTSALLTYADNPYVLVLGRIHPKKALEPLIEAFLAVTTAGGRSEWQLVIAGDGEPHYVEDVKRFADTRGGSQRVRFVGWLGGERKRAALRQAALLALPSRQENFGIVVAEAMASGTPVLVSEHVNLADEIRDSDAGWVTSLESAALARSLSAALTDEAERRRRGQAGERLARAKFTWPAVAERLTNLYRVVMRAA
jgi:glycosyltransferase involved in cell wall biosynthesis